MISDIARNMKTIKPNLVQMADVLNTLVRQEKLKQNLQKCGNADHERGRL